MPIFRVFAQELIRRAKIEQGSRLLDVGTGTGLGAFLARPLVGPDGFVVAVDRSIPMIQVARMRSRRDRIPNVTFATMDASHLGFGDGSLDRVISNCGIAYATFSDVIQEVHRVLRPHGLFAFNEWRLERVQPHRIFGDVLSKFRCKKPSSSLAKVREALSTLERFGKEFSNPSFLEGTLRKAGFSQVEVTTRNHEITLSNPEAFIEMRTSRQALIRELEEMSEPDRNLFYAELRSRLGEFVLAGGFRLGWEVFYVRAQKPL